MRSGVNADQQSMAAGEHARQRELDDLLLPEHHLADRFLGAARCRNHAFGALQDPLVQ